MSKLREKFEKLVPEHFGGMSDELQEQCEQITDDFAVKFAEFKIGLLTKQINNVFYFDYGAEWITTTELLQIFKTEYYDR